MAGLLRVYSSGAERIFYALQYRPVSVMVNSIANGARMEDVGLDK